MTTVLCIPKVTNNINKPFIYKIFNRYNFGHIEKIDLINKEDSKKAFIHFKNWNKDDKSQYVKDIITSGKDIKIIYSMPWYWICKQSNYY